MKLSNIILSINGVESPLSSAQEIIEVIEVGDSFIPTGMPFRSFVDGDPFNAHGPYQEFAYIFGFDQERPVGVGKGRVFMPFIQ